MRVRPLGYAVVGALCATLLAPAQARAHAHLARSRPAAGDTLRIAPPLLRLEFSEAPELPVSSVRLLDARGRAVALSPLRTAGDSLRVLLTDVVGPLAAGRYTVRWQVAGRDGHPVHGQYEFVIAAGAAGLMPEGPSTVVGPAPVPAPVAPAPSAPRAFDAESVPYVVVRWAQFTGLLVVIGAVAFRLLVLAGVRRRHPQSAALDDATARALGLARAGALLLALTSVARFVAQRAAMRDASTAPPGMQMEVAMLRTWWGEAWVGQSVAVAMLLVGLALARRRPAIGWGVAAVATVLVAITVASSGHAAASAAPFSVVFDALHLLAAGGWMGGLFVLLAAGLPAVRSAPEPERRTTMASMVNGFSTTALAFAGVVVFTGVNAAWRNVETSSALFESAYGRVLLVKLAALAVAALVGFYNWRRARPALAVTGDDAAIRRAMRAELAAGVVILLVTAVLVALPTPVDLVRMR